MSVQVDSEGYVTGFVPGERAYRELKHPALSYSLAKSVLSCPEDAWRLTQRCERVERERTGAMDDGSIVDSILTSDVAWNESDCPVQQWTAATKAPTPSLNYSDWNGLRILSCDTLQTKAAKECAADARANDLTPVLADRFTREVNRAQEMLVRMELAGFDRRQYMYQVSVYWTEIAANGTKIQCRGRLDFLAHDWGSVVDLKRVESLDERSLQSAVDRYRWALQAAAYSRAVVMLGQGVPTWYWLFARTLPVVACTLRPIDATLLQAGECAWNRAVNDWAEGLATGVWRGHESNHLPIEATSWTLAQMEVDLV